MRENKKINIGACIMVHNMAPFIGACVRSLHWVDGIFVFDDHSTDGSLDVARKYSDIPIYCEQSSAKDLAFKRGELESRNYILTQAFQKLKADAMIVIDADEMLSSFIKPYIIEMCESRATDALAFPIWHLYNERKYLHFWETKINGVTMIDPHTRIVKKGKYFTPLFDDGSHPTIQATTATRCLNGPYHFHLKYYYRNTLPNYSLYFSPERMTLSDVAPYIQELPFELPKDVVSALSVVNWDTLPYYKETPHHKLKRVVLNNPHEALIHPKDKIKS